MKFILYVWYIVILFLLSSVSCYLEQTSQFTRLWCVFLPNRQRPLPTWLAVSPAEYQSRRLPGAARLARISTWSLRAQRGGEGFCACRGNSYSQRQGFGAQACGNCSSTPPKGTPTCRRHQNKNKTNPTLSNQNRLLPQTCLISPRSSA